jgi:hypothetical protein
MKRRALIVVGAFGLVLAGTGTGTAQADNCHGQLTAAFAQAGISGQDVATFIETTFPYSLLAPVIDQAFGNGNGDLTSGEVHKAAKALFCS